MSEGDISTERNICRLCLINGAKICIFDEKSVLSNIKTCCKLEVFKDDGMPTSVCMNCTLKLEDLAKFITQCHESERILRDSLDVQNESESKIFHNRIIDFEDDSISNFNYDDSVDFEIPDKFDSNKDEKGLMENVQISESGEEFLHYAGIKIIVNRSTSAEHKKKSLVGLKRRATLCPVCGKTVVKSLTNHMRLHGEKTHSCDICSKAFPLKEKLKKHVKTHSDVRDFTCAECFKQFKTKDQLKKHIYAIHNEPLTLHPCGLCNKPFKSAHGLKEHLKIHTGEQNHQCPICNRKFTYKVSLTVHMRVHTGERPFQCKYCEKSFSMSKSLKDHERLHTGEKPYECPVCDKGFMQMSNMKSHFRNNHKGVEFKRKKNVNK